jgi:PAS domain S-box-containing protein
LPTTSRRPRPHPPQEAPPTDGFHPIGTELGLASPVLHDGQRIGTLYLRFDARAMQHELLLPVFVILGACSILALLAAFVFSSSFQHLISTPVLALTRTARSIADNKDYSVRAEAVGADEFGTLTAAFNQMLSRIEEQNAALRDSEAHYRLLFQSNPMPMFVHHPISFALLAANDAAVDHYGYPTSELLRLSLSDLRVDAPDPSALEPVAHPSGVGSVRCVRHRKRDGTVLDVEVTTDLIEFSGRPACLALCLDVTARKRAEQQLAVAFDELEARVQARTRELSLAKVAAEAASDAKSRFLAMMSHEIRTPLNGVTGVLHLLLRDQPNPQQRRRIEMAQNSARTLLCVINDILDFSKVEAGKLELRAAPTRLHATLSNTAASFAYKVADKGLSWSLHIDPAVPRVVTTDADRLAQILGNFLSNAIKFTDSGSVSLRVAAVPQPGPAASSEAAARVRFEVCDTGPGIHPDQLQRLFLPFSQLDNSTTRRHGGTGLGLGICKHLVELMGGLIGVQSQPGHGSTFWFELPFALPPASSPAPIPDLLPSPTTPGPAPTAPRLDSKRVLLAEDNDINRELAAEMITCTGCSCDFATNGDEAVQAVRSRQFDLVFMDCMMPGTDGYGATRIIRAEEIHDSANGHARRRIPIVAMTANAMAGDREVCLAAGMDDYLSKPLHPDDVAAMLRKWLGVEDAASHPRS